MKRRIVAVVLATVLGAVCITGCGNTQETVESTAQVSTEAQTTQAAETAAARHARPSTSQRRSLYVAGA